MKALLLSTLLLLSINCFSQSKINQDSLKKAYLVKARQSPEYRAAFSQVNAVKSNIVLAKKGTLKSGDVVKDYNERLGDLMGKKQTLKEVDIRINNDGDKFLQFVLLKCAAKLANEDAAKLSN